MKLNGVSIRSYARLLLESENENSTMVVLGENRKNMKNDEKFNICFVEINLQYNLENIRFHACRRLKIKHLQFRVATLPLKRIKRRTIHNGNFIVIFFFAYNEQ